MLPAVNEDLLFLNLSYTRDVVTYMSHVDSAEVFATEIKPTTLRKNAQLRGWPKPLKIKWSTIIFTSLAWPHPILQEREGVW